MKGPRRILVPVKGTEASRRAAELACALAQSGRCGVDILYVVEAGDAGSTFGNAAARRLSRDVLADIDRVAERYEVPLRKHVRVSDKPAEAVLRQAKRARSDLILVGTDLRKSDALPLGAMADSLLAQHDVPVALLTV